jgi:hypothetical protein
MQPESQLLCMLAFKLTQPIADSIRQLLARCSSHFVPKLGYNQGADTSNPSSLFCRGCHCVPAALEAEAKASLLSLMREWLQEKVAMADKVLVEHAVTKVYDGDVILTYAYSQVSSMLEL